MICTLCTYISNYLNFVIFFWCREIEKLFTKCKNAKTYLGRWYQYRMMSAVYTTEAPQSKAEARIRIQTESDVSGGIEFARQLHGAAQGGDRCMRHFNTGEHACCRNAKVQIGQHLRGRCSIHYWQFFLWHVVHIQNQWPTLHIDHIVRLLYEITRIDDAHFTLALQSTSRNIFSYLCL